MTRAELMAEAARRRAELGLDEGLGMPNATPDAGAEVFAPPPAVELDEPTAKPLTSAADVAGGPPKVTDQRPERVSSTPGPGPVPRGAIYGMDVAAPSPTPEYPSVSKYHAILAHDPDADATKPEKPVAANVPPPSQPPTETPADKPSYAMDESKGDRVSQALYSAFTNKPLSEKFFAEPGQEAFKRDLVNRQAAAKAAAAKKNAVDDVAAKEAFIRAFPTLAQQMGPDVIRQMSVEHLAKYIPIQDKRTEEERKKAGDEAKPELIGLRGDEQRKTQAAGEPGKDKRAQMQIDAAQIAAGVKREDQLGTEIGKNYFGDMAAALDKIEALAPGMIRGKAPADNPLTWDQMAMLKDPTGMLSNFADPRAVELHKAMQELRDLVSRQRSGAVLNETESQHYSNLLGDKALASPESMASGINQIRQGIKQKLRNMQSPYLNNGLLDKFEGRGGTSYRKGAFADPEDAALPPAEAAPGSHAPAPGDVGPVTAADTGKIREAYAKAHTALPDAGALTGPAIVEPAARPDGSVAIPPPVQNTQRTPAPADGGRVLMKDAKGRPHTVPASEVAEALKHNWTQVK